METVSSKRRHCPPLCLPKAPLPTRHYGNSKSTPPANSLLASQQTHSGSGPSKTTSVIQTKSLQTTCTPSIKGLFLESMIRVFGQWLSHPRRPMWGLFRIIRNSVCLRTWIRRPSISRIAIVSSYLIFTQGM
jgi:hypothetical protein